MRRLLVVLAVLVALFVAADRVAVGFAERAVALRIEAAEHLSSRPSVSIGGFPFLTQAVAGRYDDVAVTMAGLPRGELRLTRLSVHLHGAHVSLAAILGGHVDGVRVDSGSATTFVSYSDLDAALARDGLTASYGGSPGMVRLTSKLGLSGVARLGVTPHSLEASVGPASVLTFHKTVSGMPFGVGFTSVTSDPAGVTIAASGTSFTIPTG